MNFSKTYASFLLCILVIVLMSCESMQYATVLKSAPERPVLVVIPANDFYYEHEFASKIQEAIIYSGIRVKIYVPPAKKEITTEQSLGQIEASGKVETYDKGQPSEMGAKGDLRSGEAKKIVRFSEYEGNTDADYIVRSSALYRRITIIKYDTKEVMALTNLKWPQTQNYQYQIYYVLESIGLPVIRMDEYIKSKKNTGSTHKEEK